jgi:hypothetical protein
MTTLKEEYSDRVQIVYKQTPISEIHPQAENAARAVQAAQFQGDSKGFAYSSLVLANQTEGLNSTNLSAWAEQSGLDIERWNTDRTSTEVRKLIDWDLRDIRDSTFPESVNGRGNKPQGTTTGTPANVIFVNGKLDSYIAGSEPIEGMRRYLDAALEKAGVAAQATTITSDDLTALDPADAALQEQPAIVEELNN